MIKNFNDNWIFSNFGDITKNVSLPYDAMINEERDITCLNSKNTGYFPGGKYLYTKQFIIPKKEINLVYIIRFEGVYQNSEIYINDYLAHKQKNGYTEFEVNISDFVVAGNNVVKVVVDNSYEPNSRWYTGSGIYRDVWLIKRNQFSPTKLKIRTISIDPVILHVEADKNALIKIYDKNLTLYEGEPGNIKLDNVQLWDINNPYLYRCVSERGEDYISTDFGIRMINWSAEDGLIINGKEVLLRGGCIHSDNGILGANDFEDSALRRIKILKEAGYNAIRSAHNPVSRHLLNACDRLGMLIMDEAYDGWYIPKTYHDFSRNFMDEWKNDLKSMIDKDYNHPSVIMYSIGNEVSETTSDKGIKLAGEMIKYLKSLDISRPVTCGINVLINVYANMGIGVYKERNSYDQNTRVVPKRYRTKRTGSQFFNYVIQLLGPLMFIVSKGRKGDNATKKIAEKLDILGLNYGSSRYDEDFKKYPNRIMLGTETMYSDLPYNWKRVKENKGLIGDFVWAAWDYLGEAGIGDWVYESYDGFPILAGSGGIDITGYVGAEVYYSQVVWGIRERPYICVRPLHHYKETPSKSAWRFTNALSSWNYSIYEGVKAQVEIFSTGKFVELFLNDKKIGKKKLSKFKSIFKVKYNAGKLKAISYDENNQKIGEETLISGEKIFFIAELDKVKLTRGSNELCHIDIYFKDENGTIVPYIEQKVKIESNELNLLGFGNARSKTNESYNSKIHSTYNGHVLAIFKAGIKKGIHEIHISTEGYPNIVKRIEVI